MSDLPIRARDESRTRSFEEMKGRHLQQQLGRLKGQVSDRDLQQMMAYSGTEASTKLDTARMRALMRAAEKAQEPSPMSRWELRRRHEKGQDKSEIEAEAIERSYNSVGIGGRIEEYANGALEWVPNGPGDVPQPPTGDTFFDPIRDEQAKMKSDATMKQLIQSMIKSGGIVDPSSQRYRDMMRKLARGGVVKNFQSGGLAEVALPPPEEEEQAITSEQLVERATNPAAGQSLSEMILMNKQGAIERLRATRENLSSRRDDARKREKQDKWQCYHLRRPARSARTSAWLRVHCVTNVREGQMLK
jgi:hypothetical protein